MTEPDPTLATITATFADLEVVNPAAATRWSTLAAALRSPA